MQQCISTEVFTGTSRSGDLIDRLSGFRIVDSHLHLGHLASLNCPGGSDEYIVSLLKKYGVEKAIFSHHAALSTFTTGLEKTFDTLEKHGDILLAYHVFNPNFSEDSLDAIKSLKDDRRFLAVKIHPSWHACYPYDIKYQKFWEYADDNGLVVLTHSWNPNVPNRAQKFSDPFFFEQIIRRYSNVRLILAHAAGRGEYLYKVIDLLESNENLYVDFSGDVFVPGLIEEYIARLGSERLLFGSDMPWIDIRFHLTNIINSNISQTDKANIFGLNSIRLFEL